MVLFRTTPTHLEIIIYGICKELNNCLNICFQSVHYNMKKQKLQGDVIKYQQLEEIKSGIKICVSTHLYSPLRFTTAKNERVKNAVQNTSQNFGVLGPMEVILRDSRETIKSQSQTRTNVSAPT